MRKLTLIVVFAVVATLSANAQIGFGIKGGLNFANIDIENADPDSKTGYHFGVFAEVGAGGIAIQPEVLISAKGSDDVDLTYIEIPVLLKKNFAKVLNIHVGPQFGILTTAEGSEGNDMKDFLKTTDLSLVAGAGVNLPAGLTGGVRYVFGLSDINDDTDASDVKITNKTLQVYVGWKLFGN